LFDACVTALPDVPNLRLVVIGSGPLEAELRQHLTDRQLADVALLAGSRGDVPELLPAFDVFAMSSRYEGLPIALMEAMAAGLPSVLTAVGGIPEMVSDGVQGLLVPAGDSAAMAAGIVRLARDGQLRADMAAAALQRGCTFDIRNATKRIWDLYESVTGGVAA
jgi:glycosyltransferase involved in cell wall biosynthesis